MSKIKVIVCEPGKLARVAEIENNIETYQKIVGGYYQPYYPFGSDVAVIGDDDGKYKNYPENRAIRNNNGNVIDYFVGTIFICGVKKHEFCSLTDKQIEKFTKKFKYPEMFFKTSGGIQAIPYKP